MTKLLILLPLVMSFSVTWSQATESPTTCARADTAAKTAHLPDTVWMSLKRGQPQRLLVSIVGSDLTDLARAEQLKAYDSRKQSILQALPADGVQLLRWLDQLPMMEFEVRTEQALRTLLANCWVGEIYLDREEPALQPKGTR